MASSELNFTCQNSKECVIFAQYFGGKDAMSKRKIILMTLLAFSSGMFTHAQLYARPHQVTVDPLPQNVSSGKASWYSKRSPGIRKRTANNEIFNDQAYTAAMWGVPFNQKIKVTNLDNGKSVIVRVNDRGPHRRFVRRGRVIDLSRQAFVQIASPRKGLINVQLELL